MSNIGHIKNPLTVVGIFAGTTEAVGAAALPFILAANQYIFMWFLIIFPSALVVIFFLFLYFKPSVLYAPSDFREDETWFKANKTALTGLIYKETEPEESTEDLSLLSEMNERNMAFIKTLGGKYTWRTIRGVARELGHSKQSVQTEMDFLSSRNLVFKSAKKERWALTKEGRLLLEKSKPKPFS
jgi:hypothetical protein